MPSLGRVLLVDDHALFRKGFASLLLARGGVEIVGEAGDGLEAIEKARQLKPDLILMDVKMPGCSGIEATRIITADQPGTKVVMLTVSDDDETVFEAIKSGACGYLLKNLDPTELFDLLDGVSRGEAPISRPMATKILQEFADRTRHRPAGEQERTELTRREMEVLQLLTTGSTNRQIAATLRITENTVKNHLRNILDKLHVDNRVQAAALALREGLVSRKSPGAADHPDGPSE